MAKLEWEGKGHFPASAKPAQFTTADAVR